MEVTLLGTSDAYGLPVPLCDCEYCQTSQKRRRPSALVETENVTLVLDAGPDIKEQLQHEDVYDVDMFYLTHHHFDHAEGLSDLLHIAIEDNYLNPEEFDHPTHGKTIQVRCPDDTMATIRREKNYLLDAVDVEVFPSTATGTHGSLTVTPVRVAHGRKDTYGYVVEDGETDETVVYAPDMAGWRTSSDALTGADVLVVEGAEIVGPELHGPTDAVVSAIERADADRTVLVNVSEHTAELHTDELVEAAAPYSVVDDFTTLL